MLRRHNIFFYFNDLINLLFIFTLFNDRFTVKHLGETSLRVMFLVFMFFNLIRIYRNFMNRGVLRELAPFFAFIILNYISLLVNPGSTKTVDIINNFLLLFGALIIMVFYINYDLKKVLYFIWISMVASVLILIFNPTLTEWTFRRTGGTGDPNEFASQLLAFMLISVYLFRKNQKIFFIIFSSIVFIYALFQAGSLSSFLTLGVLIIFILARYFRFSFARGVITSAVMIVILFFTFVTMQEKIAGLKEVDNILERSAKTRTAQSRFASWQAGIRMIVDKPILGVGMNAYAANSPIYSKVFLGKDAVAPHNIYIKSLAETGIIVFASLIYFLFILLSKYFRMVVESDYFWLYLVSVSYLLMGLTLGLNYNKYLWLNFAILSNIHLQIYYQQKKLIMQERTLA